ncbi:ATP-dependent helicase [Aeromonas caviae]|uniref:ATP-dependent helicase n=1 Tax=Aeromonas caviae TaxID=648 RepID=UPI0029DD18EE|nr:ATP-dependent helicase [Aeromonas caviae]MDX7786341.1 ATP-dependent helicase [Aeromonas caviae]
MFSWTDKELNREQSEAIHTPGSVFLVACPGSGKTRTLTYKIAYELSRLESEQQFIIAITYTHRAAEEIQERIENLGVDTSQLWIGTIHSFCLEWIIKPYFIYEPNLAHGYRIIDLHDREKLLERLCEPYAAQRVTFYDCDYYFAPDGYYLSCPDIRKHEFVHRILTEYFQTLLANKQIDFELILWYAYRLIETLPHINILLSKIFSMVLVDEYQDTKQIQYSIITSILRTGAGATQLFMVGDPNQAIYGTLGGYPISIEELRELSGIPINTRELSQNYRSSIKIVDYFSNFNVHNTNITASGGDRHYAGVVEYNRQVHRDALVDEIVRHIRHNVEVLGIPMNEICVIAPQWSHLVAMTRRLVVAMPTYQFDGPGMVPFSRDSENFWYKLAKIILTEPSPTMYGRRLRWAGDILADLDNAGVDISKLSRTEILRQSNSIIINEEEGLIYLECFFNALFDRLGIQYVNYPLLVDHYIAFFASSRQRIDRLTADGVNEIGSLNFFKKVFQSKAGVTISTIHGVKGAEFDVVIAFALLEGMVPHFNDRDGGVSARKMLYVVGSRARKNLYLFSETGRNRGGNFGMYQPTQALADCNYPYDNL